MKHTSEQVQVNFYKYPDRGISGSSPAGTLGIAEVVKFWMSSSKHIRASRKGSAQNVEHRDAAAYSQPAPSGPTQTTTADYYLLRGVGILMTPSVLHQDNFPLWMCSVATQRSAPHTFRRAHTHNRQESCSESDACEFDVHRPTSRWNKHGIYSLAHSKNGLCCREGGCFLLE